MAARRLEQMRLIRSRSLLHTAIFKIVVPVPKTIVQLVRTRPPKQVHEALGEAAPLERIELAPGNIEIVVRQCTDDIGDLGD